MAQTLQNKAISGVIWSFIQKFGTMGISFFSNIILARLLSPDDYGCIGMLAIFILISTTLVNGGFGSALIQKKNPTSQDYSTIFFWNIFVSIIFYILIFLAAPLIADFYHIEKLTSVLRVEATIIIINSFIIVQENQYRKQLQFKKLSLVYLASAFVSVAVAIFLAYNSFGVWSLVYQQIVMSFTTAVLLWISSKWRPQFTFSVDSFKDLFSFGFYILLSDILNTICDNVQGLLIGRFYTPASMGYYTQAHKLDQIASTSISSVINQVSYPMLSTFQNDLNQMVKILQKFTSILAFVTIPVMLYLIILAKPIILILYSDKWLASVPYFQILCIAGIANCLQGINYYAVAATGRSDILFRWSLVKRGFGLCFIVIGLATGGILGLLWGMVCSSFFIYFINAFLVSRKVGYSIRQQAIDLFPILLIGVISFLIVQLLQFVFNNEITASIMGFVCFPTIYICFSKLFHLDSYYKTKSIIYSLILRKNDKCCS